MKWFWHKKQDPIVRKVIYTESPPNYSITNGMSGVSNAKIEAPYRIIYYRNGHRTGELICGSLLITTLDKLQHDDTCLIEEVRILT